MGSSDKKRGGALPSATHVSESVRRLNPSFYGGSAPAPVAIPVPEKSTLKRKRRRVMNGTEARMADILEARRKRGELTKFTFEGITLRWGNEEDFTYTPDFTVLTPTEGGYGAPHLLFIEVKGAHIRQKDWDRFKHARDNHPEFQFELWQWKERNWIQIA